MVDNKEIDDKNTAVNSLKNKSSKSWETIKTQTTEKEVKPQNEENTETNIEFDWENHESTDSWKSEKRKELEKVYEETLSTVVEKDVTEGTVIEINKKEVVVDISFKSNGIISNNEFRYNPDLKVGDKVEVYVESQEDKKGELILSHKKARMVRAWERVKDAFSKNETIKGFVKSRTKGGMIVDVFGIEAFMPGSQIDIKLVKDFDQYVDQVMEVKIVKINEDFKNVVVSHKVLIQAKIEKEKDKIIATLEKGQIVEGVVKNITSYGVFVDIGGIDGLVHITDLSWGRISYPTELVEIDQKIQVVILDFDNEKRRIALGLKQLQPHPWDELDPKLKEGDIIKGKVVVLADYGAFIEIIPGIEGLIHVSEISWSQHLNSAQDFLNIGDEVESKILTLDRSEKKISLGIKQLKPDPWEAITEKFPIGTKHKAIVRNFTKFGIFAELEEGVDGLIHISDLSWTKHIKHPAEFTSLATSIEVIILDIDKDNRRLSLGHKQIKENPWEVYETIFTPGSIHQGKIKEIVPKRGAVIEFSHGIQSFTVSRYLIKEDRSNIKIGEELPFKVIEFSKNNQKIIVSHTQTYRDNKRTEQFIQKKKTDRNIEVINRNIEKTTLGDIKELYGLQDEKLKKLEQKEITEKSQKKIKDEKGKKTTVSQEKPKKEDAKVKK